MFSLPSEPFDSGSTKPAAQHTDALIREEDVYSMLLIVFMHHISAFNSQNRKNDEASYEKMLKLRRDLSRAVTILEMIKRREKSKRELLHLTLEIFEKR